LRFGWSPDLGYAIVQSDVAAVAEEAARVFERLGHRLEPIAGGPPVLGDEWGLLGSFEAAAKLHEVIDRERDRFGRAFLAGIDAGRRMTPEIWGIAARKRAALVDWCAEVFERVDVLLTPTLPYDPPPAKGPFPAETEGRPQPDFSV